MADEEAKEGADEAALEAAKAAASQKKKKLMMIGAGATFLLLVLIVVLYFVFGREKVLGANAAQASGEGFVEEGSRVEEEYGENEAALGAMFPFDTFVVNLAGGGFIKVQMQLEFVGRSIPKKFMTKLVPLRDAIISLLSSKKRADLLNRDGKEDLKAEVIGVVNEMLGKEDIKNAYFTNFVIQ